MPTTNTSSSSSSTYVFDLHQECSDSNCRVCYLFEDEEEADAEAETKLSSSSSSSTDTKSAGEPDLTEGEVPAEPNADSNTETASARWEVVHPADGFSEAETAVILLADADKDEALVTYMVDLAIGETQLMHYDEGEHTRGFGDFNEGDSFYLSEGESYRISVLRWLDGVVGDAL
ncbi:hypothetical protein BDV18DRAFT_161060 [Aspergillus unguis]